MSMFTIVLMHTADSAPIRKVYDFNNNYLSREEKENSSDYPLLSEISEVDICVFSSKDMNKLIKELESLKSILETDNCRHISEVIDLAKLCQQNEEYVLGITPFTTFLNKSELESVFHK